MYSKVGNKTFKDLESDLIEVYIAYYRDYKNLDFKEMVKLFADDDFYNLHFVAKEYLKRKGD